MSVPDEWVYKSPKEIVKVPQEFSIVISPDGRVEKYVLRSEYIKTLDRAHAAEEKLDCVFSLMDDAFELQADNDKFIENLRMTWSDLSIRFNAKKLSSEKKLEAIKLHMRCPDKGSEPWLRYLEDLLYIGAAQAQNAVPSVGQAKSPSLDTINCKEI